MLVGMERISGVGNPQPHAEFRRSGQSPRTSTETLRDAPGPISAAAGASGIASVADSAHRATEAIPEAPAAALIGPDRRKRAPAVAEERLHFDQLPAGGRRTRLEPATEHDSGADTYGVVADMQGARAGHDERELPGGAHDPARPRIAEAQHASLAGSCRVVEATALAGAHDSNQPKIAGRQTRSRQH